MRAIRFPSTFLALPAALILALVMLSGCPRTGTRVLVTPGAGYDTVPRTVAVYPMLSTEFLQPMQAPVRRDDIRVYPQRRGEGGDDKEGIYIAPPTESKLLVTGHSQLFSDLLAADLAYHGFTIKQLPVEASVGNGGNDDDGQRFYVSMELLDRLRDEFGLEAVLLGNVYFERAYPDADLDVTTAYIKVVDVKTLDIVCQVSITNEFAGIDIEEAVERLATELAGAGGPVSQAQ
jgi:hypothetical protein